MEIAGIVGGIAVLALVTLLGAAAGALRARASVPKGARVVPLILFGMIVAVPLALAIRGTVVAAMAYEGGDPQTRIPLLAAGISEAINCMIAVGVLAFAFAAGLILTLIVAGRSSRSVRTRPSA